VNLEERLRAKKDNAYCRYMELDRRGESLGWEARLCGGGWGEEELIVHKKAAEELGRHYAFHEAAEMAAKEAMEPMKDDGSGKITFTKNELENMAKNPDVLRAVANYHSRSETEADAIGDFPECVRFHENRRIELNAGADRIEAEWLAD